jgi:formylglycine-generating enzyme required for sulfatase activity
MFPHHVPSPTRTKRNVKEGGQEPSLSVSKRERKKPVISQSAITAYLPERFKPNLRLYGVIAGTLLVLTLSLWGGANLLNNQPFTIAEPTQTLQPTATRTHPPAQTNTPSPTQTSVPPTPTLGIGSTVTGKDGMTLLYVPSGEFTMGSNNGGSDEKPVHKVHLMPFGLIKPK